MEINSIERIWKEATLEGFETKKEIPISFKNIESIHFIDKFKSRYRLNLMGLIATAIVILIAFTFGGVPIEGLILFTVFSLITVLGYRKLNRLKYLNKENSTRDYVLAFNNWLNIMLNEFQFTYRFIYPILFLTFISAFFRTNIFSMLFGETLWESIVSNSSTYLYKGLPIIYIVAFLIMAILISVFSKRLFILDINSVYGRMKMELDTILKELDN
ncbi:hypothetical protein [Winogradskyella flava]|uniref:hypothetical protein n=1 Tax=Winogradskyella flava TaxID=1884876 RepID=UPI0024915379|nr:hypothetical protein [Winogradskyella flava]